MPIKLRRPMLACSESILPSELESLSYPIYGTPKEDGLRATLVFNEETSVVEARSRSMLLIPNCFVQLWAEECGLHGMDGELIIPGAPFHDIQSIIMTRYSVPFKLVYRVFDRWDSSGGYLQRVQKMQASLLENKNKIRGYEPLYPVTLRNPRDVIAYEEKMVKAGYEGIILRSGDGPYKQGRSTRNQGWMLKMKRFADSEGEIVAVIELEHNDNPKETSPIGLTKRSSHKVNMRGSGMMGALRVRDLKTGEVFNVGSGFTKEQRIDLWNARHTLRARIITYKKQLHGEKNKPRSPIFKGFRLD